MFYHSDTCTASLTAALESRNADQQVNGRKDINYIDTAGFCYATEEKKWDDNTCRKMGKTRNHYLKQNISDLKECCMLSFLCRLYILEGGSVMKLGRELDVFSQSWGSGKKCDTIYVVWEKKEIWQRWAGPGRREMGKENQQKKVWTRGL